ncbi:MAG: uroporphyrinogen decarboxylase [Chlamydiota bacterium]
MNTITSSLFLEALASKEVKRPPVWLMRQAGRYLPQYLKLRSKHSLSALFHDPDLATEVTLLPLQIFPLDAAIVFSDLLILAEVWDKKVFYPESGGPYIQPKVEQETDLFFVTEEEILQKLSYIFATIKQLKPLLNVPLIGFCGAPFTMLCYLLEGKGGHTFPTVRLWMEKRPKEFSSLLHKICKTTISYAKLQIEAGVDAIQIFDSWTHLLSKEEFLLYALPYWQEMQLHLKAFGIPTLFFSRANSLYPEEIASIRPSAISFDEGKSLASLRLLVPEGIAVQGNFSPEFLLSASAAEVRQESFLMAQSVKGQKGIIFNLGHGVLPKTPVENVLAFLEGIRQS